MSARRPGKVPAPPAGLSDAERVAWLELARDVERAQTFTEGCLAAFRLLVEMTALARSPEARQMPATARVRLMQAAAGLMREFGLTPSMAAKVPKVKPGRDPKWDRYFDD